MRYNIIKKYQMSRLLLFSLFLLTVWAADGQVQVPSGGIETKLSIEGKIYPALITENGDTLILVDLDNVCLLYTSPSPRDS